MIIPMLDDGVLPNFRNDEHSPAWREERRLFYVGVTRAMEQLHLLYYRQHGASVFVRSIQREIELEE